MNEKSKTVLHDFIEIVSKSKHKRIILWIDHGREFYNKLMQMIMMIFSCSQLLIKVTQ